MLIKETQQV